MSIIVDKVIIGAGLYGLYSALYCGKKNEKIIVLECENESFKRASYINQARVHMGYHYPRSYSTAIKSANYFERFSEDYKFCINNSFQQIYATSTDFSWSNAEQFSKFCSATNIRCENVSTEKYFNNLMCDGAFLTKEYTYDANILKTFFLNELKKYQNVNIVYNAKIKTIDTGDFYEITLQTGEKYKTPFILNSTYASINQVLNILGFETFKIKYELCEVILCNVSDNLDNVGITVMDGPFFSIMPFGKTGYHSLTSVTFTPHLTSYDVLPTFKCQKDSNGYCSSEQLGNCNNCPAKPKSAWDYMYNLAKKYLKDEYEIKYIKSLFSIKPILMASEIDDSRPTVIKVHTKKPTFVSVLSGKINTVYDLEEVLDNGNK